MRTAAVETSAFSSHVRGAWARYANILLGIWLIVSDLVARHPLGLRQQAWSFGALVSFFALWAMVSPRMRIVTAVLGAWLFFWSITAAPVSRAWAVADMVCGVVIFALAWVPGPRRAERHVSWPLPEEESGIFTGEGGYRRE